MHVQARCPLPHVRHSPRICTLSWLQGRALCAIVPRLQVLRLHERQRLRAWVSTFIRLIPAVGQFLFSRLFRYVEDDHVHTKYEKNPYPVNQESTRVGMLDATILETLT